MEYEERQGIRKHIRSMTSVLGDSYLEQIHVLSCCILLVIFKMVVLHLGKFAQTPYPLKF